MGSSPGCVSAVALWGLLSSSWIKRPRNNFCYVQQDLKDILIYIGTGIGVKEKRSPKQNKFLIKKGEVLLLLFVNYFRAG